MINFKSSKSVVVISVLIVLYLSYNTGFTRIYTWDAFGQYIYLPMLFDQGQFIYHDLTYFEILNQKYDLTGNLYQFVNLENGCFITKYTMGLAVLLLPFYMLAECWALIGGYTSDGFTFPYQVMAAIGASFYFVLGLFFLRKLLLYYFKDSLTSLLLILVVFGTNYLYMQYASIGSTHNFEFTLVSMMLYFNIKFHEKQSYKNAILLSLTIGLIALVRLPDLMLVLIPVFWKNEAKESFLKKVLQFYKQDAKQLLLMVGIVLFLLSLQLLYWKINADSWFMNSYANNHGEGFDWFQPYIWEILFSFRKGWFIYTPIMLLSVIGLIGSYIKLQNGKLLLFVFLLFFYVISCWTTWWYAASYSCRAMVDLYPILLIGLGVLCLEINSKKIKPLFYSVIFLFLLLNIFQTFQITKGIIPSDRMSKAYYISVFGQFRRPSEEQQKLLLLNRDELLRKRTIDLHSFYKAKAKTHTFQNEVVLNDSTIYTPKICYPLKKLSNKKYFWLKVRWEYDGVLEQLNGKNFIMCLNYMDKPYGWEAFHLTDSITHINDSKKMIEFLYLTPHFRTDNDFVCFGIWKQYGDSIIIKSMSFEVFEPYFENE